MSRFHWNILLFSACWHQAGVRRGREEVVGDVGCRPPQHHCTLERAQGRQGAAELLGSDELLPEVHTKGGPTPQAAHGGTQGQP